MRTRRMNRSSSTLRRRRYGNEVVEDDDDKEDLLLHNWEADLELLDQEWERDLEELAWEQSFKKGWEPHHALQQTPSPPPADRRKAENCVPEDFTSAAAGARKEGGTIGKEFFVSTPSTAAGSNLRRRALGTN